MVSGVSVLIVDDDEQVRPAVAAMVRRLGGEAATCASVAEAVAVLAIAPVDLVVTDVDLGAQSGLDLARHVRGLGLQAPVILMSGRLAIDVRAMLQPDDRIADVLEKPFGLGALADAIARALPPVRRG